jgi:dihydroflavonol-4-reductase
MILVTGGTGLIGSHLLYELVKRGYAVRALYRSETKKINVKNVFDFYSSGENHNYDSIEWVKGDVLDLVSLEDAFQNIDIVYHCAAKVSYKRRDFRSLILTNRLGTSNVVNMALKFGVKKFGHISSTAAIGGVEGVVVTEKTKWSATTVTSGYAISKYNSEREVWRASEEGMEVVIINPSIVFGAGNFDDSSLTIFKSVKKGLKFYSPGQNAFVDVRDVVDCLIKLMESTVSEERYLCFSENKKFKTVLDQIAQELNTKKPSICPPKSLAILLGRLNEFVFRIFGRGSSITVETARSAYSEMTYSNEKIGKELNHSFISVEDSIKNVVAFYRWKENRR